MAAGMVTFKEQYAGALAGWESFWTRTNRARPVLNLSYNDPKEPPYRPYASLEEKWLDEDYISAKFRRDVGNTGYLAEGVPMIFTNLGPGCFAACIGGDYVLAPQTIWFDRHPIVADWSFRPQIAFDPQSAMWRQITRLQDRFAREGFHFSITDLGGIFDIVASLRGTEALLYDLYDAPDEVRAFTREVAALWTAAFDRQVETVGATGQPYNNWMNLPSALPWYPLQCDFCAMISPAQFERFVLPELTEQAAHMPRSIYHLDGPGEIPHLDMLLDIPGLNGIQWVSGAGSAPLTDEKWFPLYRRIQDKKKNVVLLGGVSENDPAGAERLIKSLDPTGVALTLRCSSRAKAEDMAEKIERWSE